MDTTINLNIYACMGLVLGILALAYGVAWSAFKAKAGGLRNERDQCREDVGVLTSRLQKAADEKGRLEAEFEDLERRCEASEEQLADREAELETLGRRCEDLQRQLADREADMQASQGEGMTFVREWAGFYQVIIRSFLNVPVHAQGHIRPARMLERHSFDITIDPDEEYPKVVRSVPGSGT